jgi:hypothetical protein
MLAGIRSVAREQDLIDRPVNSKFGMVVRCFKPWCVFVSVCFVFFIVVVVIVWIYSWKEVLCAFCSLHFVIMHGPP